MAGKGTERGTENFAKAERGSVRAKANDRLKALDCRCSIQQRNEQFYLRARVPDKGTGLIKQQRLPLGKISIKQAEEEGIRLGHLLRNQEFTWDAWEGIDPTGIRVITAGEFRQAARQLFEKKKRAESTWKRKWRTALNKLPKADDAPITESFLLKLVESMPVGSCGRRNDGTYLSRYAEFVGMNGAAIREASLGYSEKDVVKRDPPSDEKIEEAFNKIKAPHWRWQFACAAVYGLRPHEIPLVTFNDEWECIVPDETKTGFHVAWPLHSRWIDLFGIKDIRRGNQTPENMSNSWRNARQPRRYNIDIPLYDLRHAYAIRCLRKGIQSTIAARLMGHTVMIHERTYRRWIDQADLRAMKAHFDL